VNLSIDMRGRRTVAAATFAVLCVLAFGAPANAANRDRDSVRITHEPEISGSLNSGATLTAVNATWEGTGTPVATYRWGRCEGSGGDDGEFDCELTDVTGTSYALTDADIGKRIFVWLQVTSGRARDNRPSALSAPVDKAVPPPPPPPPAPAPAQNQGTQPPAPVVAPNPAPPVGGVLPQTSSLRYLTPFPVVRIKGWLTPAGARVTVLTVRAPKGAKISVRCVGKYCPRKRYARATKLVHLKPYQRLLRGSVRLVISVTRKGFVGKQTTITLRPGKAPTRRDLCLYPGAQRAKKCTGI
jgi:hypothetical protein